MNRAERRVALKGLRNIVRQAKKQAARATVELRYGRCSVVYACLCALVLDRDISWLSLMLRGMLNPRELVCDALRVASYGVRTRGVRFFLTHMRA